MKDVNYKTKPQPLSYERAFELNGKIPPQALDLEEVVLGALLIDQDAVTNTIDIIREEYFYSPENEAIFRAIKQLFLSSEPIDILTVVEELKKEGTLEMVGGAYKVSSLTSRVVSSAHIESHARVLAEKYIQRELIRLSTDTIKNAYDESTDIIDLLDKTETSLLEVNDKNFRSDTQSLQSLVQQAQQEIEDIRKSGGKTSGLESGFRGLDTLTAGFHKGTLIILAARPGVGKTAFALSIARNIAVDRKVPIAFFSLEMTAIELAMRLVSAETQIPGEKLRKGEQLSSIEQERLKHIEALASAPMYIDDTPNLKIFDLRAKCRRLKQKYDIQMVFIDYLQLMNGSTDNNRNGNREQEISTISRQLKALSKELQIPIFALAQLSRAVEQRGGTKKPVLSDLRESGAIEQDADIVMFIYRPDYYGLNDEEGAEAQGMADIILAKHRAGPVGEFKLRFEKELAKFVDADFTYSSMQNMDANTFFDAEGNLNAIKPSKINDMPEEENNVYPDDEPAF